MGFDQQIITCASCGAILEESQDTSNEKRPCTNCGDIKRLVKVFISDQVNCHGMLKGKKRNNISSKPLIEFKVGSDLYRKFGKWVRREMQIDRENNRYKEKVIDTLTQEVIHECDEPLSEHKGHGSTKFSKK